MPRPQQRLRIRQAAKPQQSRQSPTRHRGVDEARMPVGQISVEGSMNVAAGCLCQSELAPLRAQRVAPQPEAFLSPVSDGTMR